MASSSRIIAAADIEHAEPFNLGALGSTTRGSNHQRAASIRQADANPLKQSFEIGYKRGFAEGQSRATQAIDAQAMRLGATLADRLDAILDASQREFARFEQLAADRIVDLAVQLARQMTDTTFDTDRQAIVPIVRQALSALVGQPVHGSLRLNPMDMDAVAAQLAPVLARRQLDLVADPSIAVGGCLLTSPIAEIDARKDERWLKVLAAIGRAPETAALAPPVPPAP